MRLIHPTGPYNNLPAEDVFFAVDDVGAMHGLGYLVYQCQPSLYPDCPVNLYFSLESQPASRQMLLGALMARARMIRDYDPTVRARVYTSVDPGDQETLAFYAGNGLSLEDGEQRVWMSVLPGFPTAPMGCQLAETPLQSVQDQQAFIQRFHDNDLTYITPNILNQLQYLPHRLTVGLVRANALMGEAVFGGQGDQVELYGIYIDYTQRHHGLGQALLRQSMGLLANEGVTRINASLLLRSEPQKKLFGAFQCQSVGYSAIYPGLYL